VKAVLYGPICFHGSDSEIFKWQELWHTSRTLQPGEILYQILKVNKLLNVDTT